MFTFYFMTVMIELDKANDEIERMRNTFCEVLDGNRDELTIGKTFDYGGSLYATGDADDPSFLKDLSKTFDMGTKPVVIPVLDFKRLKHVKAFKDWHGYSQKLEKSQILLRK